MSQELGKISMLPVESVHLSVPISRIRHCVDVYSIFRFEPTHNLSLRISLLFEKCLWNMLNDDARDFDAVKSAVGTCRFFKFLRQIVLMTLN